MRDLGQGNVRDGNRKMKVSLFSSELRVINRMYFQPMLVAHFLHFLDR
jgi:hypothetical protein